MHRTHLVSIRPERAHKTRQNDDPRIHEQSTNLAGPSDVFASISLAESEIAVQPMAEIIPVQSVAEPAGRRELPLDLDGNRALTAAREPREPDGPGNLSELAFSGRSID